MPHDSRHMPASAEARIAVALERVSEAFRVLLWNQGKLHGLSPIQVQLLVFLHTRSHRPATVSALASEFNMTKATISDSVKALLRKDLAFAVTDAADSRSFAIHLSDEGRRIATEAEHFARAIENGLSGLSEIQKETMYSGLLDLIKSLNDQQVITPQRMCGNCRFYSNNGEGHHCALLGAPLLPTQLQVDCPDFSPET